MVAFTAPQLQDDKICFGQSTSSTTNSVPVGSLLYGTPAPFGPFIVPSNYAGGSSPFGSNVTSTGRTPLFGSSPPSFGVPSTGGQTSDCSAGNTLFGGGGVDAMGASTGLNQSSQSEFQDSKTCFGQSTSSTSAPSSSLFNSTPARFGPFPGPSNYAGTSSPFERDVPSCGIPPLSACSSPNFRVPPSTSGQTSNCSAGNTLFSGVASMGASTGFNSSCFVGSTAGNQCRGTSIVPYLATCTPEIPTRVMMQSISAMTIYKDKCHEELRWEDYKLNNRGKPGPLEPFGRPANMFGPSTSSDPSTVTAAFGPLISSLSPSSSANLSVHQSQGFVFAIMFPTELPSNLVWPPLQNFACQGFPSPSVPAQCTILNFGPFPTFTQQTHPNDCQSSHASPFFIASVTSRSPGAPVLNALQPGQVTTTNPGQQPHGEASEHKARASFQVNVNSIEVDDVSMPKLPNGDYYSEPSIEELEASEIAQPGYCSHVKDFLVGRNGIGSVKFLGEVDVRGLDLQTIIHFNKGEVIVYMDGRKRPPVGQGLNRPAEITLRNVKCTGKVTGKQYTDGPHVQRFEKKLVEKAAEIGAEFVSYDPHQGEWKFKVQHF